MTNIPNIISVARILCVPFLIYLIVDGAMETAFWVFLLAGLSDAIDGFIAKRFKAKTQLGAILDPLADKTLLVGSFVTLGVLNLVPFWLVILAVGRDVLIIAAVSLLRKQDRSFRVRPIIASKLNTMLQIILVLIILGHTHIYAPSIQMMEGLVIATAATTIISFLLYSQVFMKQLIKAGRDNLS